MRVWWVQLLRFTKAGFCVVEYIGIVVLTRQAVQRTFFAMSSWAAFNLATESSSTELAVAVCSELLECNTSVTSRARPSRQPSRSFSHILVSIITQAYVRGAHGEQATAGNIHAASCRGLQYLPLFLQVLRK